MNRARITVVFLLSFSFLWGQTTLNKSPISGKAFVYHNDSIKALDFHAGTISCLSQNTWVVFGSLPELPAEMRINSHPPPTVIQTPDTTLISFSGSGLVYSLGRNGGITRHDRTYFSGYNFGALRFFDGNRLWSIGGYGLWRVTDLTLFYDHELREWERQPMRPSIIEGFGDGFYSLVAPGVLRMAVSSRADFNGSEVQLMVLEADLKNKTYRFVGSPVVDLDLFNNTDNLGYASNGTWNLLYEENRLLLANLAENRLIQTPLTNAFAQAFDGNSGALLHPKGVLFVEVASTVTNNHYKIVQTELKKLLNNPENKEIGPIYEPYWVNQVRANLKLIASLLLGLGGLTALIIRYRRSRPVAERAFAQELSPSQRILFKHLMILPADASITTLELNQILGIEEKTWDNQRKIRSTLLQELEEKGMKHLGVPSFIERISSEDDRRIRRYRIKPELRDDLISVLKYV